MTLTSPFVALRRGLLASLWLTALFLLSALPTLAATFTVTNNNDSGAGSLRQAVLDANGVAGADTIVFAANVTGTITLTTGEIVITQPLTITGPGANVLAISGNNNSRVFNVSVVVPVTITGLTITQGNVAGFGGGMRSSGPLTLNNCHFTGNTATGVVGGGGVHINSADGSFTACTFSDNVAGNQGGGINFMGNGGRTLTLTNCTITGNRANGSGVGGAIFNFTTGGGGTTTLQVNNCTIANNTSATTGGGGITNDAQNVGNTTTTILRSTIVANNTLPNLNIADELGGGPSTITSQGFNLASDGGSGFLNQATDILNTNPLLGALANNGGPTPTLALLAGSPAIDKGNSFGLATEQRGFARTVDFAAIANAAGGDGTDIGAFERNFNDTNPGLARVSDSKVGSLLVFPYYTSTIGGGVNVPFTNFGPATLEAQGGSDTRMTISNISNAAATVANQAYVHLFLIDGTTCNQADFFLCLTPNASFSFRASDYDPGNTGYMIAVAVNNQGVPTQNNVLLGNAFLTTPTIAGNYGAESFWANSATVATVTGNTATLAFDNNGYDTVPSQFAVEIQSPLDAAGQQIITASLSGNLNTSQLTGAAQVGTGQAFNEKEAFGSFQNWLIGTCQARATISTASPRVPNGLGNLIRTGQAGYLKFNVGGAVGLLLTPRGGAWTGIRTLHKTQTTATTLTIPIFVPVC